MSGKNAEPTQPTGAWRACRDEQCQTYQRCMAAPMPCSAIGSAVPTQTTERLTLVADGTDEYGNEQFRVVRSVTAAKATIISVQAQPPAPPAQPPAQPPGTPDR
jgi:hypothetical protein